MDHSPTVCTHLFFFNLCDISHMDFLDLVISGFLDPLEYKAATTTISCN